MKLTLAEWRRLRGLSRKKLGELVGKSQLTIRNWERGDSERKPSEIEALRKALNLTDEDVLILP